VKSDNQRGIRIERTLPNTHLEDETGHLWAVSYADFLMVLLSFFVIFFSVAPEEKSVILEILSRVTKTHEGGAPGRDPSSTGSGGGAYAAAGGPAELASDIEKSIPDLKIQTDKNKKSIYVQFPDGIYRSGGTQLNAEGKKRLSDFLDLIAPYVSQVQVIFIGHTDSRGVRDIYGKYLSNNFDLSSLRASQALKMALEKGLDRDHLFTLGAADHTRSARTLSVLLKPMGALEL
jgi:flagellar motor protein MotB